MRWRKIAQDRWAFGGWAVLGLGVLLLVVGIPVSIWAVQRSGGPGPPPPGSSETIAPARPGAESATISDSVELQIHRAQGAPAVDAPSPEAGGSSAIDGAAVSDAVEVDVQRAPAEPAQAEPEGVGPRGGGRGTGVAVTDNVQLVVRDSTGKIKEQSVAD